MRFLPLLLLLATPVLAQAPPPACTFPRGGEELDEDCLALLAGIAADWQAAQARGAAPGLAVRGFAREQQGPRLDGLISRRRAVAVAEELRRLGVDPDRLEVTTPALPDRQAGRLVDPFSRRVEIVAR